MGVIRASNAREDKETAIKEQLRAYRALAKKIKILSEILESRVNRVTSKIAEVKVTTTPRNVVEDRILNKLDLERQFTENIAQMQEKMSSVMSFISDLTGDEYAVIFNHYIMGVSMDKVADLLHVSLSGCWRLHRRAICRLSQKVDSGLTVN